MGEVLPHINRIGTAHGAHEVHGIFRRWAEGQAPEGRERAIFTRMASRAGIERRWSVMPPIGHGADTVGGFYGGGMPSTAARMRAYAEEAPPLALRAVEALGPLGPISHVVVASCTGFIAPGLDQLLAERLRLPRGVERTMIGFMGCYAAVIALRTAYQIVRADPAARVLVVAVELCTLHLQASQNLEALLAMLQFGDGAGAAIVSTDAEGLALTRFASETLPESGHLITWTIGDEGFVMQLAGAVPGAIAEALEDAEVRERISGPEPVDSWAVHPGGRSVLDAVERGLTLPSDALDASRAVLRDHGNMSSATLMFVLRRMAAERRVANGVALAFGPGVAAEAFGFRSAE